MSYEHFEIIKDVFRRFVNFLDGRQVVVALSGGLDSKLVVGMLRYFEYENVLCYTYGKGNSREAIKAEAVSEQFGYNWILTEYSGDMWKQTLRDKDLHKYWASATNGVSLPHCWDWPSLKMIKRMDIVDEDAVFVTGISGDFVAGNHLKNIFDPRYNRDPHDFIELMINKHYSLWLNLIRIPAIFSLAESRIRGATLYTDEKSDAYISSIYEYWEWQERQSKYIVNLVRQHDFFGYAWAMPLWDRKIMDFWKKVPLRLKKGQYLYEKSVSEHYPDGGFSSNAPSSLWEREPLLRRLEKGRFGVGLTRRKLFLWLESLALIGPLFKRYARIKIHYRYYKKQAVALEQGFGFFRYVFMDPDKRHQDSMVTKEFMKEIYDMDIDSIEGGRF